MATNKNVIVFVPNGRRQNVAVTPNTTILQILEEVCQRHGYNVNDYDLKHFNHVLDPNAILRFTGLANNAQLEMIPCTKIRSISTVVIGVQLENGERLMSEFTPDVTLAEILHNVNINEDFERITLIYMHREISGTEALKNITLKSLGLNNGKAVLRLIHKSPQNMHVVTSTILKTVNSNENLKKSKRNFENEYSLVTESSKKPDFIISSDKEIQKSKKLEESSKINESNVIASTSADNYTRNRISLQSCNKSETDDLNNIQFLGERNALIFNQATIQGTTRDEFPDEFYDLTIDDAKILIRDAKHYRKELEEAPLLTNAQRQLNQEKRILNQLNKYRYTIIRIQFPDQFILQGLFKPMETVQTIKTFIKGYLIDEDSDFILFTTPPKYILNLDASLVNENLVPCAVIHYSGPSALKLDVKQKCTDPKKVKLQVTKFRTLMTNQENQVINEDVNIEDSKNKDCKIPK